MLKNEIPELLERLCNGVLATLARRGHRELRGPIPEKTSRSLTSWSYNHKLNVSISATEVGDDLVFLMTAQAGSLFVQVEEIAPEGRDLTKHWGRFANKVADANLFGIFDELRSERKPPVSFRAFDPRPKSIDNRGLRPLGVA